MKENGQPRKQRAYKVKDEFYDKAQKRANKGDATLANLIENVVIAYSFGMDIVATKPLKFSLDLHLKMDSMGSEGIIEAVKNKK